MEAIGSSLRKAREARGLTVEQVAAATRIRARFIHALEEAAPEEFPSLVQLRGFLRNYAAYLGLDVFEVLADFERWQRAREAEAAAAREAARRPVAGTSPLAAPAVKPERVPPEDRQGPAAGQPGVQATLPTKRPSTLPAWLTGDIIAAFFIMGVLLSGLVWGYLQLNNTREVESSPPSTPTPSVTPVATLSAATPTPWESAFETPTPAGTPPPPPGTFRDVQITLQISERTWLLVTTDGRLAFQGLVPADTAQSYQADATIVLRTGNAGAVDVTYNGRPLGPLGQRNAVVEAIWGPAGPLEPTATPSPTPTPTFTPTPTSTFTPTFTPTPTSTSTPTYTPTYTPRPPPTVPPRQETIQAPQP